MKEKKSKVVEMSRVSWRHEDDALMAFQLNTWIEYLKWDTGNS